MAQQDEARMVNEYLVQNHRMEPQWKRVRLGVAADPSQARLMRTSLKYADAVVISGNEVLIYEFKITPKLDAIGQLLGYRDLFPITPEFSRYAQLPIRMVLVTTREDRNVRASAEAQGIEYRVFRPSNIADVERRRLRLG